MRYYVIDAFAKELFSGNPAGVCLLDHKLPAEVMQRIAFENNLAETAFLLYEKGQYRLRWFTPDTEIDLCGHATLATAFVLMTEIHPAMDYVEFHTMSGTLTVKRSGDRFLMDFPSREPEPVAIPPLLEQVMGCRVLETHLSRDLLVLVEDENTVKALQPDMKLLSQISDSLAFGIVVTAQGDNCDFVSRYFAPNAGVQEDPVTGSSHCTLIPFWSKRQHKTVMEARQLSKRGGILSCEDRGDRVLIGGTAVCYLKGELQLD